MFGRVEQLAVGGESRSEAVPPLERVADRRARVGDRDELEPVTQLREEGEVHGLGDEPAAHDADSDPHARTCVATFSKANAISSRSWSSQSGEMSMWIERSSRSRVRGQSGGSPPASAIAVRTGAQNG